MSSSAPTRSTIFIWGNNAFGKLGVGDVSADITPTALQIGLPSKCVAVAANGRSSAALVETGELFVWGDICQGGFATRSLQEHAARTELPPHTSVAHCCPSGSAVRQVLPEFCATRLSASSCPRAR